MKKSVRDMTIAITILGIMGAPISISAAYADDKSDVAGTEKSFFEQFLSVNDTSFEKEEITEDVGQFLNLKNNNADDQYILLTEPKEKNQPMLLLSDPEENSGPELKINHKYQYAPSLSFNLPSSLSTSFVGQSNLRSGGQGGSQIILSITPSNGSGPKFARKSVNLVIGSSYLKAPVDNLSTLLNDNYLSQQAYNLSLGIGYSGFHLGASYSRNNYLLSDDLSGFDLGFGYMGNSWSADVRVGAYNRDRAALFASDYNIFDNVSAYELGAAYRIFSNVNFTGRFTYYSYGQGGDAVALDDMQTLIFGTNLSF